MSSRVSVVASKRLSKQVSVRYLPTRGHQTGATLIEFSIISLSLILLGLLTLQMGLLYHAKTVLNYATFEAARVGAVNNASLFWMRSELGYRLAPLQGGDGSRNGAERAATQSIAEVFDITNTKLIILNPTQAAFNDWGVQDSVSGELVIPVNHLRHQETSVGDVSGLSLRDANILKLKVVHGVELKVPFAGEVLSSLMRWVDPGNLLYYQRNLWPMHSVATVRMQSDAYESEVSNGAGPIADNTPINGPGHEWGSVPGNVPVDVPSNVPSNEPSNEPSTESSPDSPVVVADNELEPCEPEQIRAINARAVTHASTEAAGPLSEPSNLMATQEFRLLLAFQD